MSNILDQQTLLELLDSNSLSESEKFALVRAQAKLIRQREMKVHWVKFKAYISFKLGQVINHRAISQVFSSPLIRN